MALEEISINKKGELKISRASKQEGLVLIHKKVAHF